MKFVKYIGTKPLKRDELTGLVFAPGQVHQVDQANLARMAKHTDMYREADAPEGSGVPPAPPGLAEVLAARQAQRKLEDESAAHLSVPVDVKGLDLPALQSYALREFGLKIDDTVKVDEVRAQVVNLVRGRELEIGAVKLDYSETPSARPKPETPEQAARRAAAKPKRNKPLVVPPDPRDAGLEYTGSHNGPQAVGQAPVAPPGSNDLGQPLGAE